jgi:O-antigen ligase
MNSSSDINREPFAERLLFWSLCLLFFFIPLATSPAVIAGAAVIGIWLFSGKCIRDRHIWLNAEWFKPVILFVLLHWAGLLWTNDIRTGVGFAEKSYYWLYAFAIASVNTDKSKTDAMFKAFILGLILISTISLLQVIGILPAFKNFSTLYAGKPGKHISGSLLSVFGVSMLSFYFTETSRLRNKLIIICLMLVLSATIFLTESRAGYLVFIIASPLMLYNMLDKKHFKKLPILIVIIVVIISLSPIVQNRINQALDEIQLYRNGNPNTSIGLRLHMWEGALKIFSEKPMLGAGTGSYAAEMKKYAHPNLSPEFQVLSQPHNSFLYVATSFGIIGLSVFIWLLYVFMKKGIKAFDTKNGFAITSYGLVLIIGSLTDTQILSLSTATMFALMTGIEAIKNER